MSAQIPRRVLVTGGTGFIGAQVARSYAAAGAEVTVTGRSPSQAATHARATPGVHFVPCDVVALSPANSSAFAGQELVVHAAAHIRAANLDDRVQQRKVNVDGTRNVIAACRLHGVRRLVHISTCAAIGIPPGDSEPADEGFVYNLEHLDQGYSLTKLAAEKAVLAANGPSLETVVVNPGFVFGWDGTAFRGHDVIDRVLQRRLVVCTAGGLSIVHIDDVVAGIRAAAVKGRPGHRYILAGDNVSFRDIADIVCRLSGHRRWVVSLPPATTRRLARALQRIKLGPAAAIGARLAHLDRYALQHYSSAKARHEVGYTARPFTEIAAEVLGGAGARQDA